MAFFAMPGGSRDIIASCRQLHLPPSARALSGLRPFHGEPTEGGGERGLKAVWLARKHGEHIRSYSIYEAGRSLGIVASRRHFRLPRFRPCPSWRIIEDNLSQLCSIDLLAAGKENVGAGESVVKLLRQVRNIYMVSE